MTDRQEVHIPRFFVEQDDSLSQGKAFVYKGNYWEVKKSHDEGLDIF